MHEKDRKTEEQGLVSRSFSLDRENVEWLERVNEKSGRKSVSNTLNHMLTQLREGKGMNVHG